MGPFTALDRMWQTYLWYLLKVNVSYWTPFQVRTVLRRKRQSKTFFSHFAIFSKSHYTVLDITHSSMDFFLHPLSVLWKSCEDRDSTHPRLKRRWFVPVILTFYSDDFKKKRKKRHFYKYFCSVYRAMNQSHILMDKSLLLHEHVKSVNCFSPFYCLLSIIFMEHFFLFCFPFFSNRID